ncbi:MAG TPA: ABC transporter permease [Vicinamibacterales bacterium]|nr:ABC transporter permease [Vicinamibacterales bacterium]
MPSEHRPRQLLRLSRRFWAWLAPGRSERELTRQVSADLQLYEDAYLGRGLAPDEAARRARRAFGGVEQVKERHRDARSFPWLDDLRHDLVAAQRSFFRTPLFSLLAVGTLALGIGSIGAVGAVANAILLRPLPYDRPNELVMVWTDNTRERRPEYPMSPANFLDYKAAARRVRSVEAIFSFVTMSTLRTGAGSEQIAVSVVSPGTFALLGRGAALGRTLTPDDRSGVVVLSDAFFTRRFGRDPGIVGQRLIIDNTPSLVAGVMAADFRFPYPGMFGPSGFTTRTDADVWAVLDPADPNSRFKDASGQVVRSVHFLSVLGRLADGSSVAQARSEALAIASHLEQAYPDVNAGLRANVVPLHEQAVGRLRPAIVLLGVGAAFVLLLAAVNIANLLLARSVTRQKELAVRAALGAGRSRLARQLLTETLTLSAAAAALGWLLALIATRAFVAQAPAEIPRLSEVGLDWRMAVFTVATALVVGVLLAIAPLAAIGESRGRRDLSNALTDAGRGQSASASTRRLRTALACIEVSLAVVLTVGAGLLVRSFAALAAVDPGFQSDQLLTLQLSLPPEVATPDARRLFYRDLFARLESIQGVVRAGGTTRLPLGSTSVTTRVEVEGRGRDASDLFEVEFRRAVHDYFRTMGMPIVRGRDFQATDGPPSPSVVIVNQAMARKVWGDRDPIGQHLRTGSDDTPWSTVIGVVGDVHHANLDQPPMPEMYISYLAGPPVSPFIVLRTVGDPSALAERVRSELKQVDKDLVIYNMRTGEALTSEALAGRRFIASLAAVSSALALILAALGVYGVMALVVSERTREMGIRIALGADGPRVLGLVVGQGMLVAGIGLGVGLAASLALTPLMSEQLFGVRPLDPITLVMVTMLLSASALIACIVPAWRATQVDPIAVLRCD